MPKSSSLRMTGTCTFCLHNWSLKNLLPAAITTLCTLMWCSYNRKLYKLKLTHHYQHHLTSHMMSRSRRPFWLRSCCSCSHSKWLWSSITMGMGPMDWDILTFIRRFELMKTFSEIYDKMKHNLRKPSEIMNFKPVILF